VNRRKFIEVGMGAALAVRTTITQAQAPANAAPVASSGDLQKIDTYSRYLHWLRTPDEVAEAVIEMGYDGLDITVQSPGHVDPANVKDQLPSFVNTIRKRGIRVTTLRCAITDADSPYTEDILAAAASLGIQYYWGLGLRYASDQPIMSQLDSFKPKVAKIAALNEKYKITGMYHTYEGDTPVGAAIWDLLYLLKDFDPKYVALHYDLGHMSIAGGNRTWVTNFRAAEKYIAGISVKDAVWDSGVHLTDGGPYAGQPLGGFGPPGGRGPGSGGPGGPAGSGELTGTGGPRGAGQGRGGQAPAPGSATVPGGGRAPTAPPDAGAGVGGRAGRGPGGGGRGPGAEAVSGRGGGGTANPWRIRQVPLGEGIDDLPRFAALVKEMNFSGPLEIQAEYPNGGADTGQDKITLPREIVLGNLKRDRLILRTAFATVGL
jgi:L-ribulose-5-phosphate 3-epimerase